MSPTSGPVGIAVTLTGTNFGASQGSTSTISLNGTAAVATNWSSTSITAMVPTGASSGIFSATVNGQTAQSTSFTVTALPSGWSDGDIGTVGVAGSGTYANGVFTVQGAGQEVYGTSDAFNFACQSMTGDGTILARVVSVQGYSGYATAGVMIRETLDAGSTNGATAAWPNYNTISFDLRTSAGGSSSQPGYVSQSLPYWVKVVRSGSTFSSFVSADGVNWTQLGSNQTISMAQSTYVGLAVNSGTTSSSAIATFDSVSVSPTASPAPVITSASPASGVVGTQVTIAGSGFGSSQNGSLVTFNTTLATIVSWSDTSIVTNVGTGATSGPLIVSLAPSMNDSNPVTFTVPLPSPWTDLDIGTVGTAGSAAFANGAFTVQGAGTGEGGSADGLNFLYQPLSGDGTIIARVASVSSAYAQAGVMIRETLNAGSTHAFMMSNVGAMYFYGRATTGAGTSYQQFTQNQNLPTISTTLPFWMKLVRSGNVFSTYIATDGVNWMQVGTSVAINMAQNVYIGLAISSGSTSSLFTGTFDNVSVNSTASPAPVITGVSATTVSAGSQVVVSGSNFGTSQGSSVVLLNDTPVTINSWSTTSISITIPSGATSGSLVVSGAPSMIDSNPVEFTVTSALLPSGWLDQDIGEVGAAGSATYTSGVFTVKGSGCGIDANCGFGGAPAPDSFHFVYQPLSGDGTIIARLTSVSSAYAQAGVMIRETMDPAATTVFVADYAGAVSTYYRTLSGGTPNALSNSVSAPVPYWVKLVRIGNSFNAYQSTDGISWTAIGGAVEISMAQNVYIGLAMSSTNRSTLFTATFDNVSLSSTAITAPVITSLSSTTGPVGSQVVISGSGFGASQGSSAVLLNDTAVTISSWSATSITITIPTGATSGLMAVLVGPSMDSSNSVVFAVTSQPLPSGWFDQDIGQVGKAGNASYASGVFTVQGAGTGLGGSADAFHFVYQPMITSGTIIARVVSNNTYFGQAGVLIRETLDAGAAEMSAFTTNYTSSIGTYMDYRIFPATTMLQVSGPGENLPYWLKVVRSVNQFSAYISADNVTWTPIGTTQTFTTAETVYVGFGATSGTISSLGTVTFDNVSVTSGASVPDPVITGISPTTGGPGVAVTVSGAGFGATQNGTLTFNGATATISSWSDGQIVGIVPAGVTTGPVMVTVGNITTQGPTFTAAFGLTLTDSLGNQTTFSSSPSGGQWLYTQAQGSGCSSCTTRGTVQNLYDALGNLLSMTDAIGNTAVYLYDPSSNPTSKTVQVTSGTTATTQYTYNSFGEVLSTTDQLGSVTTNTYDSNGNLLSVTTPAPGSVTQFAYNSVGELTTITDPLNNVTTLVYTSVGLINTITDAKNNVTTYGYDSHGNRTSVTDALSHQTTFTYDSMDRLTKITYPDSTTTQFGYDYRGRRTTVTDQNGKVTTYAYDDADRLLTVTDAASNVTTYVYDTENNLTSIGDANHNTTSFTYDAFGRVTKTSFPSGHVEMYGYDADNNLTSKTDRKNQYITYAYDLMNRLTQKTYPDSTSVNYAYDLDSRLTQVTDPTGTYNFTFDNMGRLTNTSTQYSFLTSRTLTTAYSYDAASNRTEFTDPESGSTAYVYDPLNRLQTLTPPSAFTTGSFGLSYDALSRRTQMTRPNSVSTLYAYDNLSRLTSVLHQLSGSTIDGAAYTVDNTGNRTAKTDEPAGVTSNYSYDAIYELTKVMQGTNTTESYTFDPVGDRLSSLSVSPYNYNTSNELTSTPSAAYTYDYNGNVLTSTTGSNTTSYTWDFENRLTSVTLPGSGGTVSFKYDPFGRRIEKSTSSTTSIYAYDGDNLIEETNSSGAAVARYAQTETIDEPLAMLRSATTSYYQADGLGSVTSLSNAAGALAQTYTLDSFGNQTASSGSLTNPFRNTGREFDTETSLYFYRARYFDPQNGRFLSEDPSGFNDGVNFYRYVHNDPIDNADPTGLTTYKGFPADLEIQMRNAVNDVLKKLSPTGGCDGSNPPCAGKDSPKLAGIIQDAKFVYQPNSNNCGHTGPVSFTGLTHTFGVGAPAFGALCGPLASTLLHEAVHGMRHISDKKPDQIEKDCFGNTGSGKQ
jgi:RHS repeat-associated protein